MSLEFCVRKCKASRAYKEGFYTYASYMQLNYIGIALFYVLGRYTIKSLEFSAKTHKSVVLIKL